MKNRLITNYLSELHKKERGRFIVITGARQTGKTTLAGHLFPDHQYISMDDPVERVDFQRLSAKDWLFRYPLAIIDEIQKLPSLFDTLKACYDQDNKVRYLILGSSQLMVIKKVKETLAGRVAICELFPFSISEIATDSWDDHIKPPLLSLLIKEKDPKKIIELILSQNYSDQYLSRVRMVFEKFLKFGGMPPIYNETFNEEDSYQWLNDYQTTYLQRDLLDIAQLNHLEPFVRCQQALALKNGQLVNFSEVAKLANVSAPTANKFFQYLEVSYQVIMLPAFFKNREKRLAKMGKLHFLDPGIYRGVLKKRGLVEGHEFESAVVAEIYKQVRTLRLPLSLYHLRTFDGKEVDLLIELENGYLAIECKMTENVTTKDFRHLRGLQEILDKPLLAGLVVSNDRLIQIIDEKIPLLSVPAWNIVV
ncbi:MAG: ATP-binding protein [bacterium]